MCEVDRITGFVGVDLVRMMENAGRALADLVIVRYSPVSVMVLVGADGPGPHRFSWGQDRRAGWRPSPAGRHDRAWRLPQPFRSPCPSGGSAARPRSVGCSWPTSRFLRPLITTWDCRSRHLRFVRARRCECAATCDPERAVGRLETVRQRSGARQRESCRAPCGSGSIRRVRGCVRDPRSRLWRPRCGRTAPRRLPPWRTSGGRRTAPRE